MKLFLPKFELAHFSKKSEINQAKHYNKFFRMATFIPNCAGGVKGLVQLRFYNFIKQKLLKTKNDNVTTGHNGEMYLQLMESYDLHFTSTLKITTVI